MELRQITNDVYACLQADRGLGTSNSGFINRGGGLVVDTFWDLPHTRQLIDIYARVWKAPARRVVNTHHNGDHCWGNQLFAGAEIIGHRLCAAAFMKERPEALQMLRNATGSADPATAALAKAFAPEISVNSVAPGVILASDEDPRAQDLIAATPAQRSGTPEEIADAVLYFINASNFVTGQVLAVDGGLSQR